MSRNGQNWHHFLRFKEGSRELGLTVEEVLHVLENPNTETLSGIRDRAILETLYATGVRRSELTMLMDYDIDQTRQTIFVREGKNNKDRYLPLGERALQWVNRYRLEARPELLCDHQQQ